jgi:hypothetical protein
MLTAPAAVQTPPLASHACPHTDGPCPAATDGDHAAAHVVAAHPEQGWSLLCNGVIEYDDTGETLPDRRPVAPHRPAGLHTA